MMFADLLTYLPDDILTKVDRASMANGLEVRVPFLDSRVVAGAETLKTAELVRKRALKRVLLKYLPASLVNRPKTGFAVPVGKWMREKVPVRTMLWDYLLTDRQDDLLNRNYVRQLVREHDEGHNHQHKLWALLMWEMWRERWMTR